jgi:murein tripeptide amidase MpaA
LEQRKIILIQGRVHPGETNSSWIVHGILKALISKDPLSR